MKKIKLLTLTLLSTSLFSLASCKEDNSKTITIAASEVPHAKILNEVVKDILKEKGYGLSVKVLDWTLQNDALANKEVDANYFQHIPYLNQYKGSVSLIPACKVHYERLCVYTKDTSVTEVFDGARIEIVDDISNVERALNLLEANDILTINDECYDSNGNFTNFESAHPMNYVTFNEGYENCTLTCIAEELLSVSLDDYDFGVIPGNTAMTGLKDYSKKIVLSEDDPELEDQKANVIAIREEDKKSEKTKAIVESLKDERVKKYIETTFSSSVSYHFVDLINN